VKPDIFFDHFELLAEAPNGVQKLRELILQIAVQGKLVPQDPNDEHANVLLRKNAEQRARLEGEGKIRRQKELSEISEDEKKFDLPNGWEWVKLGQLMEMFNGRAFKSTEWNETGLPIIRIQNLNDATATFNYFDGELAEQHLVQDGSFLISWSGTPGTSFGAFIWNRGTAALNQHINKCLVFLEDADLEYLRLSVNSCMDHLISRAQGGVGLKHVTKGTLNNIVFGYPPLAEQPRIVAKVDQLMKLCDEVEQRQQNKRQTRIALNNSALDHMLTAPDPTIFVTHWQQINDNFDLLYDTPETILQLRQAILQLAVQGKLVPQNPNEEPAKVLLEKIAGEKTRLIKQDKIKKQKPFSEIPKQEKPFALPESWEWIRLGSAGVGSTGTTPSTRNPEYYGGDMPFLGPGQITPRGEILDLGKTLTDEGCEFSVLAEPGEILMVCIGGSIGKSAMVRSKVAFNQQINSINPILVDSTFLNYSMNTPFFQTSVLTAATGSATPIINRAKWEELLVPLPPPRRTTPHRRQCRSTHETLRRP